MMIVTGLVVVAAAVAMSVRGNESHTVAAGGTVAGVVVMRAGMAAAMAAGRVAGMSATGAMAGADAMA